MMSEKIQKFRALKHFLPEKSSKKVVLLTGARQTGKTTLAKDFYPDLNYVNLDSPEIRESVRHIHSASWGREVGVAVIDEAQKEPQVFEKVKYAFDEGMVSFSVLLGSSQILLLKKVRESLAGRVAIFELWPLMMSEMIGSQPPLFDRLLEGRAITAVLSAAASVLLGAEDAQRKEAESYLLSWGGMPALLPLSEEDRWRWLKDYEYTYLERDLGDLARLDDLGPFRKFQKLSALRSAGLLKYSELARDAGVSVDTAKRYLEYLRLSYQVVLLQPFYRNITSSVIKTPKSYWLDIGLLRQLTGYRGQMTGEIYETFVVGECVKWIKTSGRRADIYFYRTRSGLELDLLVQVEGGVFGVEIKGRPQVVAPDLRPLREVARGLGGEWLGGLVVYQGDEIRPLSEDIWAVPSRRLFTP